MLDFGCWLLQVASCNVERRACGVPTREHRTEHSVVFTLRVQPLRVPGVLGTHEVYPHSSYCVCSGRICLAKAKSNCIRMKSANEYLVKSRVVLDIRYSRGMAIAASFMLRAVLRPSSFNSILNLSRPSSILKGEMGGY